MQIYALSSLQTICSCIIFMLTIHGYRKMINIHTLMCFFYYHCKITYYLILNYNTRKCGPPEPACSHVHKQNHCNHN